MGYSREETRERREGKAPRRSGHVSRIVLVLTALSLGVFSDRGSLLPQPWGILAELGTPWLALAFWAGRRSDTLWRSGLLGASTMLLGLLAYYGWLLAVEEVAVGTLIQSYRAPAWFVAATLIGGPFGIAGGLSRIEVSEVLRTAAWNLIAAVPLAEAGGAMSWASVSQHAAVSVLLIGMCIGAIVIAVRSSRVNLFALLVGTPLLAVLLAHAQDASRTLL